MAAILLLATLNSCATKKEVEEPVAPANAQGIDVQSEEKVPYKIAYNVLVDESLYNYDVFTMNPDGSGKRNITQSKGVEWVYASFKDRLYIFSDIDTCYRCFGLYETDAYGSYFTKVTSVILDDSWIDHRKNGEEWIVKPRGEGNSTFHIIDRKGNLIEEVRVPLGYANDPVFTVDGKGIIVRGSKVGSKLKKGYHDELFEYDLQTRQLTQLTTYPKNDKTATLFDYHAGPPRKKRNGEISYSSKQNGNYSIFVYNPLVGKSRQVTKDSADEVWHDWWAEDSILVFDRLDETTRTRYHIFTMDMRTKKELQLTDTTYNFNQAPTIVLPPGKFVQPSSEY